MLECCKTVLNGVHTDKFLFHKELIKSLSWLDVDDQMRLQTWVKKNFSSEHADVIEEILNTWPNLA